MFRRGRFIKRRPFTFAEAKGLDMKLLYLPKDRITVRKGTTDFEDEKYEIKV